MCFKNNVIIKNTVLYGNIVQKKEECDDPDTILISSSKNNTVSDSDYS